MDTATEDLRRACVAPLDHPSSAWMRQAGAQVTEFLIADFAGLGERSVGQSASRADMEALLRQPPPIQGMEVEEVLREIATKILPHTLRAHHPRFLAFVPGAPTFVSILGDWLCAGLNVFAGVWKEAPAATQVEIVVLDWFKEFLGFPAGAGGILTGGGSEANLTALVVARETLPRPDWQRAVLYVSDQRHWSIDRAVKVMGLRVDQVRLVDADLSQRLASASLERAIAQDRAKNNLPWLVAANAGATNTGAVDPLEELADVCRRHQLWLHVDGAYGWPAILTDEGRALLRGIERADSITLDPHKWFAQTFEVGCVLVRHGPGLAAAFQMRPEYMEDVAPAEGEINFADYGIALTRRFRALKIWFSMKVLGLDWFRRLVEHCCRLAAYAQRLLENAGCFEMLQGRQLSILCFRCVGQLDAAGDAFHQNLCERILQTGIAFLSTTRVRERVALRLCFVNWRTTATDVEMVVELLQRLAGSASDGQSGRG